MCQSWSKGPWRKSYRKRRCIIQAFLQNAGGRKSAQVSAQYFVFVRAQVWLCWYECPTILSDEQSSLRRHYGIEDACEMLHLIEKTIPAKKKRYPKKTSNSWKFRFRLRKRYLQSMAMMSGCLDLQIRAIQTSRDSSLSCTLLAVQLQCPIMFSPVRF